MKIFGRKTPARPLALLDTPRNRIRDKALLVGIEYDDENDRAHEVNRLHLIHQDVRRLKAYLVEHEGYLEQNITVMLDDSEDLLKQPTRLNILREIDAFVKDVKPGDRRVFYFGGHGCQTLNRTGSELDGKDEGVLTKGHHGWPSDESGQPLPTDLPSDLPPDHIHRKKRKGVIVDNEFRQYLVNPLPAGSYLLALFETCHSGTILDLDSVRWLGLSQVMSLAPSAYRSLKKGVRSATITHILPSKLPTIPLGTFHRKPREPAAEPRPSPRNNTFPHNASNKKSADHVGEADVVSISSSNDSQVTWCDGVTMTSTLIHILESKLLEREATPVQVGFALRESIKKHRSDALRNNHKIKSKFKADALEDLIRKVWGKQTPQIAALDKKASLVPSNFPSPTDVWTQTLRHPLRF